MHSVRRYLDKVLEAYSVGPFYEEVKAARADYFDRAGRVAEGSEKFELQMNAFLDWYLFDRPLNKAQIAPVKLFVLEHLGKLPEEEREIFTNLTKSVHSLFELLKVKNTDVYVKDLFDGEKYVVEESDINKGFNKGDIFEGRLIKLRDHLVFGTSFVFHPSEVKAYIVKQIKTEKFQDMKQRLKLIHRLATMKLKLEQYAHIDIKHIYTDTPVF